MNRKILFLAVAGLFAEGALAQALPTGGALTRGTGSLSASGSTMTVSQTSQRAIFDFATYNVGAGGTVAYNLPNASSVSVSRVAASGGRSLIDGSITSNGHVMLLNPNGVLFGSTAVVNVASLTASTGRINDADFMASGSAPIAITGATAGSIENQGVITVAESGLAALVAPSVVNSGVITATKGRIVLASAEEATLSLNADNLYELAVNKGFASGSVTNSGTLAATGAGGTIVLSALDVANALSGVINLEGVQQAAAMVVNGGKVVLTSDLDATALSGNSDLVEVHGGAHIQDAVDIARSGARIEVWGGSYTEGHANVDYFGAPGGGQYFGLHVYKDNLVIQGLNSTGGALTGLDDPQMPVVTAQYQTGFGAQHFVSGSGVTVDGLKFKPVATGDNKTFEVIGNDFTLTHSVIDNSGNGTAAAFYISDFAIAGHPEVETFHLQNNRFIAGTTPSALVVVASGAGNSTAASNRVFSGNDLVGTPGLAGARGFQIQGQEAGIPWQPFTAGAVTVENNTFSNFAAPVRTVGILTQQLDWNSILNGNTFTGGAALAFIGGTTTARAGTVTVAAQDGSGTSNDITDTRITRDIQSSINRAQSGDTVRALTGTYAESLAINKALTLEGAGKGATIVDPTGTSADGIVASGNIGAGASVAIRNLTVQGGGNGIRVADDANLGTITLDGIVVRDNTKNGFISSNGGSNPSTVGSVNILNSVFAGNGVAGGSADINLFRFNGNAVVSNVDILGTRGPSLTVATDYGLQIRGNGEIGTMTPAGSVTLDNVRIAGNYRRAHLGVQRYSDASGVVMDGVVLGGALSANVGDGIVSVASSNAGFGRFFSSDMRGALSLGNTQFAAAAGDAPGVFDISIGGGTTGLLVDATATAFAGITRTHTAAGTENFDIENRVVHALDSAGIGGLVVWQVGNLYVTAASGSIQRGIDAAACTCDTVHVGAGTFAEQLKINKSLVLLGSGANNTIVKAPASLVADGGMNSIVTISGPTTVAEVSGFTFKGPVAGLDAGIFVRDGANAHIHNNSVVDIRDPRTDPLTDTGALSGAQSGIGIFVGRASLTTSGTALIEDNSITGYQKGGIVVDGPGSQATITGNTVTGEGPTTVIAQNGIQVSRGANATVDGNTVSGNVYTGHRADPDDFAAGILFFISNGYLGQGGITIGSGNTITANEFGIWTNDQRTLETTNLAGVSGNTRNAVAYFSGGYATQDPLLLKYPAWTASNAALVNAGTFGGKLSGDIVDAGGALRVTGWSGFTAIQPAVDAVAAGGSVNVAAGTYAESVVLNAVRNLTFNGVTLQDLTINSGAAGSGIGGSVTASGPGGFLFSAPVRLLGNTSLAANAGNITLNGNLQGAYDLSLAASGDISLLSGGSEASPLGKLTASSGNFTLTGTLWVSGYDIDAVGTVALSGHTLNSLGGVSGTIDAGGDVTGHTTSDGPVNVDSGGSVTMQVSTSAPVEIHADGPANVSGSAPSLVIDAPSGSVSGSFGDVANVGSGLIDVNGTPQLNATLAASADNNRVLPAQITTAGSAQPDGPPRSKRRRKIADAQEVLDNGEALELDLSPSND